MTIRFLSDRDLEVLSESPTFGPEARRELAARRHQSVTATRLKNFCLDEVGGNPRSGAVNTPERKEQQTMTEQTNELAIDLAICRQGAEINRQVSRHRTRRLFAALGIEIVRDQDGVARVEPIQNRRGTRLQHAAQIQAAVGTPLLR